MDVVIGGIEEGDLIIVIHNPKHSNYEAELYLGDESSIDGATQYENAEHCGQEAIIAQVTDWAKQTLFCDDTDPGTNRG